MLTIDREQAAKLIAETNGKVFTAEFVKKSGELRKLNCRLNVTSKLRGGVSTTKSYENLVTVYDMQSEGYRCINLDTLRQLKVAGNVYQIA